MNRTFLRCRDRKIDAFRSDDIGSDIACRAMQSFANHSDMSSHSGMSLSQE